MGQQLYDNFASISALNAQKEQVLAIFGEVRTGIEQLSKLGFKLDAARGITEAAQATKMLEAAQTKLIAANQKLSDQEERFALMRERELLRIDKLKAETRQKAAAADKAEAQAARENLQYLLLQEKELERLIALEDKRTLGSGKKGKRNTDIVTEILPTRTYQDGMEQDLSNRIDQLNEMERAEAELSNTATTWSKATKDANKDLSESTLFVSDAKGKFDQYTGSLRDNLAAQLAINGDIKKNKAAQREVNDEIKASNGATDTQLQKLAALREEELLLTKTSQQLTQVTKQQAAAFLAEEGSIEEMRAHLNLLQVSYEGLSAAEKAAPFGQGIKTQIDILDPALKKSEAELGKHQRNVGNYGGAITKAVSGAFGYIRQIAYILPGIGIAGILGFIVEAFTDLVTAAFKGSEALFDFAKKMEIYNNIIKEGNRDAGKQIADLKTLYKAATDVNLSMDDRLKAVKALKKEFPDYFGALSNEAILTGNAKKQYDELAASIIATSRARAAQKQLQDLEAERLDHENQVQKINTFYYNQRMRAIDVEVAGGTRLVKGQIEVEQARKKVAKLDQERSKALGEIDKKLDAINRKEKFIESFVGIKNLANAVEQDAGGKGDTPSDDINKRAADERKALFELNKMRLESEISYRKVFADAEGASSALRLQMRREEFRKELELQALENKEALALIDDRVVEERKKKGITAAELVAIDKTASLQRIKQEEQNSNKVKDITAKAESDYIRIKVEARKRDEQDERVTNDAIMKHEEEQLQERLLLNKKFYDALTNQNATRKSNSIKEAYEIYQADLKAAGTNHQKRIEAEAKFNKKIEDINLDSQASQLRNDIEFYTTQVEIAKEKGEDVFKAEAELAAAREALAKLNLKRQQTQADKEAELTEELKEAYKNLGEQVKQTFVDVIGGLFERRMNQIQEEIDKIDELKAKQIEQVQSSVDTEEHKAARIKLIEAKAQSDREALERRQKDIEHRKAVFDRAVKAAEITRSGIESVAKIKLKVFEYTAAANPILAALAAAQIPIALASAALQLVSLLAVPIPKYFTGSEWTKEGWGIAGDQGRELAYERQTGKTKLFEKPTLTYFTAGTKIWSNKVTEDMLAAAEDDRALQLLMIGNANQHEDKEVVDELKGLRKEVERLNKKPTTIIIHNNTGIESSAWWLNNMKF